MASDPTTPLGWAIQNARLAAGMNQTELGLKMNPTRTQQTVSRWEAGRMMPPVKVLKELARALSPHISADELLRAAADSSEQTGTVDPAYVKSLEERLAHLEELLGSGGFAAAPAKSKGGANGQVKRLRSVASPAPAAGRRGRKQGS
jgi:transcriptional regulator with XRE-family HTH domain